MFWKDSGIASAEGEIRRRILEAHYFDFGIGSRGDNVLNSNGWGSNPPTLFPIGSGGFPDATLFPNLREIESVINYTAGKSIPVFIVVFPQSPHYRNTAYYGKYGPTWEAGRNILAEVKQFCSGIPLCRLYDANQEGRHDYDSTMFFDEDHLSQVGGERLSRRLDSLIFSAIGPPP
jgi:hypothetical protein